MHIIAHLYERPMRRWRGEKKNYWVSLSNIVGLSWWPWGALVRVQSVRFSGLKQSQDSYVWSRLCKVDSFSSSAFLVWLWRMWANDHLWECFHQTFHTVEGRRPKFESRSQATVLTRSFWSTCMFQLLLVSQAEGEQREAELGLPCCCVIGCFCRGQAAATPLDRSMWAVVGTLALITLKRHIVSSVST